MAVDIIFETHSTSTDNERGVASGWSDPPLSATGRDQARELGGRRRSDGLVTVYTSDLQRAVQTAEIAFAGTDVPIVRDRRLRECDYGELNGAVVSRLAPRARFIEAPFPGGESYRDVVARVASFLADLDGHDRERVLVIGHTATRWSFDHLIDGRALADLVDAPFAWRPGWVYRYRR